ncbi:MAG: hypothetical protein C0599_06955 [Salinivirgaceae bacterium]|nr:MAG: hypothetical protein C0599_06955 [Salinivirgaceae bacterium]
MRKILFTLTAIVISFVAYAQYDIIDDYVKKLKFQDDVSIEQMAKLITDKSKTEADKVRANFRWIATNIVYDVNYLITGKIPDSSPKEVVKSKKAVCQGYSNLFKALNEAVGIQTFFVNGYIKESGFSFENNFDKINHSWNIALINDKWYHFDVTWASGLINDKNEYIQRVNDKYLFADPYFFVTEHLPADPMFQLLPCPIMPNEFLKRNKEVLRIAKHKKECFSFRDTLNEYLKFDTVQRLIKTVNRQLRFNASNYVYPVLQLNKIGYYYTKDINDKSINIKTRYENANHAYKHYKLAYDLLKNTSNYELKPIKEIVKTNLESTKNFIENNKLAIRSKNIQLN